MCNPPPNRDSVIGTMLMNTAMHGSSMQLHVELRYISPAIWRRLIVPAQLPLHVLHDVLQVAFGWKDCHLHAFEVADVRFGRPDPIDELLLVDERAAPIGAIAARGSTFLYQYDFGDNWEHAITVESISEPSREPPTIQCLEGARACPPEDCGSVPGYENLLRVLADPSDDQYREMKRWVGRGFDPEKFELDKLNRKLRTLAKRFQRHAHAAQYRGGD